MKKIGLLIAFIAIIFAGCSSGHIEEAPEDTAKHKIQFTAYSNEFELFAEADPFVVKQASNVLSHFSFLHDFKPLGNAKITISLTVGGQTIVQTLDEPSRKGIYSFDITPVTPGTGNIIFDIENEKGHFHVLVPEVTVYSTEDAVVEVDETVTSPGNNKIVFTKEQSWKIDFATELPVVSPFGQVIKTTAQVQSAQGDEILISARTNGIVVLASADVLEGKSVNAGKVLFTISGSDMADNSITVRLAEARNNYEKAKADYERMSELIQDKIVSEKDFLAAKNQYENAKAVYDNLNKNFSAAGQSVASSMNGFIKQVFVQNGQIVEPGQPLISISQNKVLLLRAEVQQKYAPILGTVNSANIRTLYDNQTYTLEQLNGKILSYGRNTNEDNYLIPVILQIDNNGSFVPGSFVELYLKTLTNSKALTVPNTAFMEEQGVFFVFVQVTPELFEKREVKPGATDGMKTEILSGIDLTERIVTKGAILVKLAKASGGLDAHSGHVH